MTVIIFLQRIPEKYKSGLRQKSEIIQLNAGRFFRQGVAWLPPKCQDGGERCRDNGHTDSCSVDGYSLLRWVQNDPIAGESTTGATWLLRRPYLRTARRGREVRPHELDRTRRQCIRLHIRCVNSENLPVVLRSIMYKRSREKSAAIRVW